MIMKICSVHDGKAEAWAEPMYYRAVGEAIRAFEDAANKKDHPVGLHPEDYALFELGSFDPVTGQIDPLVPPLHLATAINLVRGENG